MTSLVEKVLALSDALTAADIPYAFGGALALAYCMDDPRGTRDIDVNAFVPAADAAHVLAALPPGVSVPEGTADVVAADGQVRLWWDDTPVDLFLDYAPLHAQAARGRRVVPFAGHQISVLGSVELVLFKALFDRPKDWREPLPHDAEAVRAGSTPAGGRRRHAGSSWHPEPLPAPPGRHGPP